MCRDRQSLWYQTSSISRRTPARHPVVIEAKVEYQKIVLDDFTPVSVPIAIALSLTRVREAPLLILGLAGKNQR